MIAEGRSGCREGRNRTMAGRFASGRNLKISIQQLETYHLPAQKSTQVGVLRFNQRGTGTEIIEDAAKNAIAVVRLP